MKECESNIIYISFDDVYQNYIMKSIFGIVAQICIGDLYSNIYRDIKDLFDTNFKIHKFIRYVLKFKSLLIKVSKMSIRRTHIIILEVDYSILVN